MGEINGIINIYKEKGYTSHDLVMKVRKILWTKKVGHAGTLDPDAEGVMTVCIGKATKVIEYMVEKDKEYVATVKLGVTTDTQDITGKVITECEVPHLDKPHLLEVMNAFMGEYMQMPPMFSAIKINGKKLYELAREGKEIERETRKVYIREIELTKIVSYDEFEIRVVCSKGTYIRTLCHDIGQVLSCGACMKTLLRKRVGRFSLADCIKLEDLSNDKLLSEKLINIEDIFEKYEKIYVDELGEKTLLNGAKINLKNIRNNAIIETSNFYRVYDTTEKFIALYKCIEEEDEKLLKVEKMFI
ncbi:MAG TPA: tRNA pseudouridine(55) synthase TruB [Clostridiales bacterium]|nr:MAG: tRNA pseudouridine(55) synthase TruB [Clostridiales bacterium GWD2_32_19]HCC06698.1 tRNA pseudouridine(55) synthase TruB [Clostridiales bacterium]